MGSKSKSVSEKRLITWRKLASVCLYRVRYGSTSYQCDLVESPFGLTPTRCNAQKCPVWRRLTVVPFERTQ